MAFSSEPPRASPADLILSTSRRNPKVRARASLAGEAVARDSTRRTGRRSAGAWKSMVQLDAEAARGRRAWPPCPRPSRATGRLMTRKDLRRPRARARPRPAPSSTKCPALPSMTGTSGPSSSTRTLSMPSPLSAASRCSTVPTFTPSLPRVVASAVSTTYCAVAGMATGAGQVHPDERRCRGRPGRAAASGSPARPSAAPPHAS